MRRLKPNLKGAQELDRSLLARFLRVTMTVPAPKQVHQGTGKQQEERSGGEKVSRMRPK
jgi:hypothetical protein